MKRLNGFSLMEMMIVLTIVAIVAAASAPMVNKKMVRSASEKSPWIFVNESESIAYNLDNPNGIQDRKTASIGARIAPNNEHPRLYINTSGDANPHIAFGFNNGNLMRLIAGGDNANTWLSNREPNNATASVAMGWNSNANANRSVAVGMDSESNSPGAVSVGNRARGRAQGSIAIGDGAQAGFAGGNDANKFATIAIGSEAIAERTRSIAIGRHAEATAIRAIAMGSSGDDGQTNRARAMGASSIAIGASALAANTTSVALGDTAQTSGNGCISIGTGARTGDNIVDTPVAVNADDEDDKIAIGTGSLARKQNSIAIGHGAQADPNANSPLWEPVKRRAIAIGWEARANDSDTITIGNRFAGRRAIASGIGAVAIGTPAQATGRFSVAIGSSTNTTATVTGNAQVATTIASGESSVALGAEAIATGNDSISIGRNAGQNATGNHKICIGANSGPKAGSSWASDNYERIFIGGRSLFNDGAAVLEVHNTGIKGQFGLGNEPDSTVVINGNLIVKGTIATSMMGMSDKKKKRFVNAIGRSGGQLEPVDWGNIGTNWHSDEMGKFKVYDGTDSFSDRRLKNVGKEFKAGLAEVKKLEVFNYTFKEDKDKTPHVGVIAQDLQKIFPNAVFKGEDGFLRIRMEDMFYAVINAVKELDSRVSLLEQQQKRIDELEKRIEALEKAK